MTYPIHHDISSPLKSLKISIVQVSFHIPFLQVSEIAWLFFAPLGAPDQLGSVLQVPKNKDEHSFALLFFFSLSNNKHHLTFNPTQPNPRILIWNFFNARKEKSNNEVLTSFFCDVHCCKKLNFSFFKTFSKLLLAFESFFPSVLFVDWIKISHFSLNSWVLK